ncbi:MAG: hypothetical protein STHCBS139747_007995 [Sporothrix thermara]
MAANALYMLAVECLELYLWKWADNRFLHNAAACDQGAGTGTSNQSDSAQNNNETRYVHFLLNSFVGHLLQIRLLQMLVELAFVRSILDNALDFVAHFVARVQAAGLERRELREEARAERAFHRQREVILMRLAVARVDEAETSVANPARRSQRSPQQTKEDEERFYATAAADFEPVYRRAVVLDE